jgi:prevent-host-death family protein
MTITNMYQAKTQLSALVNSALEGEDVVIARAGKPLVRLVPYNGSMKKRKPGMLKGKISVPDNFDDESKELENLFYKGDLDVKEEDI